LEVSLRTEIRNKWIT